VSDEEHTTFTDVPYLYMTLGMFSTYLGFFVAYYYIVLYGQDTIGMSNDTAVDLLVIMNGFNLLGRIVPAFISDACLGPLNTLAPWTILSSIFAFLWISAVNSTGVFLTASCYGFASAAIQGLYTSTIVGFVGRRGPLAAKKMGIVLAAIGVAVLIGSPIGGTLIARSHGNYLHTQLFAAVSLLLGGFLFVLARYSRCGWKPEMI
jgi:predicted MFS family arabinose efflux permease